MIKKLLFFILFLGCTHDFVENKVFLEPEDDSDFFQVLEPASRKAELFLNFKTIFIINATLLSDKVLESIKLRQDSMGTSFGESMVKDNNLFFMSLFEPNSLFKKFDPDIWTIYVMLGQKKVEMSKVQYLRKEKLWSRFFPYINNWSKEYFVLFEKKDKEMILDYVKKGKTVKLVIANDKGQSSLKW